MHKNSLRDCHGQVLDIQGIVCRVVGITNDVYALMAGLWTCDKRLEVLTVASQSSRNV